jgi:uncharacterized membrane protein
MDRGFPLIRTLTTAGLAMATVVGIAVPASAVEPPTNVVVLPVPTDARTSMVSDAENSYVVGSYTLNDSSFRAARWNPDNSLTTLDPVPGTEGSGFASGINKQGDVVGTVGTKAVRWPSHAAPSVLPEFAGLAWSQARDVSDNGVIIGTGLDQSTWTLHGLRWDHAGAAPVSLPPLPGHTSAMPLDVNSAGVVVGGSIEQYSRSNEIPVRWTADGAVERLPWLPGAVDADAHSINDAGVIAGAMGFPQGRWVYWYPVTWNLDGTITKFDAMEGTNRAWAHGQDINEQGHVIGYAAGKGVIWRPDGTVFAVLEPFPGDRASAGVAFDDNLVTVAGTSGERAVRWS